LKKNKGNAADPPTADLEAKRSVFASSQVPLYYQLASLLRNKISSGEFAVGVKIPTEAELVIDYGVSRITVRQALRSLEEEGLIRREAGRGTFVNDPKAFTGTLQLDGSLDDLMSMGLATKAQLLDHKTLSVSGQEAERLDLESGAKIVRCTRIRFVGDQPYSYIVNDLPYEIGRRIPRNYLKSGSILQFLEQELGILLMSAEQSVRATLADAVVAPRLDVPIGAPLLFVDRVVFDEEGRKVERVRTYYRSDIYNFTLHLNRHKAPGNLTWAYREAPSKMAAT
jgi:GntR family transcriptional regulator